MSRCRSPRTTLLTLALSVALALCAGGCDGDGDAGAGDTAAVPDGGAETPDTAAPDAGRPAPGDTAITPDHGFVGPDAAATDAPPAPDGGADPCDPNPCDDVAGHRTRCLWDGAGGHTCHCDAGFTESEGLCCPPFASAAGGSCACEATYVDVDPAPDGLACVVRCSELTVEALNGWCPDGEICTQGVCVADRCAGVDCPENATCVVRRDEGVCRCAEPYHMSDGLCCGPNESNEGGACRCDPGYEPGGEIGCVPAADNPCLAGPCDGEDDWHRRTCVPLEAAPGYRCDCDAGYAPDPATGRCALERWETCPDPLLCRRGYCVPEDRSQEQCLVDEDCRAFDPTAPTTCNPQAAGGICLGCRYHSDCPGNAQCNDYGTCANLCDDDDDCPYGRCFAGLGLCGQASCTSDADCFGGTVCVDEDGSGTGQCHRIPCVETDCSVHNPSGACPNPGEACVYGACLASCEPNPCDQEPNRTVCELTAAGPACRCAPGFVEGEDGGCAPDATDTCGPGFACEGGFCVDRTDPGFQCAVDGDCGAIACSSPATLPSGKCTGCETAADCPRADTCLAGYCLQSCLGDADCNAAMVCTVQGYCGTRSCAGPADCPTGYTCSDGGGCVRRPCAP